MKKFKVLKAFGENEVDAVIELEDNEATKGLIAAGLVEEVVEEKDAAMVQAELATEIKATVADGIKAGVEATMKALTKELKASPRIQGVHERSLDDGMKGYKSEDEFYRCAKAGEKGQMDDRQKAYHAEVNEEWSKAPSGNNEGVGADGGFLLTPDMSNRMLSRGTAALPLLGLVDHITMTSNAVTVNGYADHNANTTTNRYAGVIPYWVAEAGQITASDLEFRQVDLRLNKLGVLAYVTEELMEDSPNFGGRLTEQAGTAMSDTVAASLMFGTGVGQPLGAFTGAPSIDTAAETGQDADTAVYENIVNMWANVWSGSQDSAIWLYNPELFPQLATMVLSVGTGGSAMFTPAGGASGAPYNQLLGRPAYVSGHCKALGDSGDILCGDYSQYLFGTKGTVQTAMSIHLRFDYAETAWRFTWRLDGRPAWDQSFRPVNGASTKRESPFVKLEERAG